jgi:hypothetical protein
MKNRITSVPRDPTRYDTWSAFKQDLELNLWCHVENSLWLKIKPKRPLPWHDSDMEAAISQLSDVLALGQNQVKLN